MGDLFQYYRKPFLLSSRKKSCVKIECDELSENDWDCVARWIVTQIMPKFGLVYGVPTGGYPLQERLEEFITPDNQHILIVDDVLTTGASMEKMKTWVWKKHIESEGGARRGTNQRWIKGAVLFSRTNRTAPWITPIFRANIVLDCLPGAKPSKNWKTVS